MLSYAKLTSCWLSLSIKLRKENRGRFHQRALTVESGLPVNTDSVTTQCPNFLLHHFPVSVQQTEDERDDRVFHKLTSEEMIRKTRI